MSDARPKRVYVMVAPTGDGRIVAEVIDDAKSKPGRPAVLHRVTGTDMRGVQIGAIQFAREHGYEIMGREEAAAAIRRMMGR